MQRGCFQAIGLAFCLLLTTQLGCRKSSAEKNSEAPAIALALKLITPTGLQRHLVELAGDKYEGRNAGYPGDEMSTAYIAQHFARVGLAPVGDVLNVQKSYFQHFEFVPRRPPQPANKMRTRNVVGFIQGTDENLKQEIVMIGAHHDGQGKAGQADPGRVYDGDSTDTIWNSADDNGSGVASLLEMAGALTAAKVRAKRSILFIAFGAEEHGLFGEEALRRSGLSRLGGSEFYATHPIFAWDRHFAMINMEMLGHSPEIAMGIYGANANSVWKRVIRNVSKMIDAPVDTYPALELCCDDYPFRSRGIPAIMFGVPGDRGHYHRRHDHAELIDCESLAKRSRFILAILIETANF